MIQTPRLRLLAKRGGRFLMLCLAMLSSPSHATWYEEIMEPGADIIMMDLRWPWWPSGTYYANWNTGFGTDKGTLSFYGGFVTTLENGPDETPNPDASKQNTYHPGNVWSWWGSSKAGVPPIYIDCAPTLALKNQAAGEGCAASLAARGGAWPFMTCKRWYTQLARLWVPTDVGADFAYCGRWIKDVQNNTWHMIAILKVPFRVEAFGQNQGFIEPFGGSNVVRPLDRRFGYYRKDGEWHKSNRLAINKRSFVVMEALPEGDYEYHGIEYSPSTRHLPYAIKGGRILPGDQRVEVEVKQPDKPTLDTPGLEDVRAIRGDGQVVVSWGVPEHASPFFEYKIEVFDNPQCAGEPKAVKRRRMPNARYASVDTDVGNPTIRMTAWDIFDQQAKPVVLTASRVSATAAAAESQDLFPGLEYQVHKRQAGGDERPHWQRLADLPSSKVIKKGVARGFDIRVRGKENSNVAITFEGLIEVPREGTYIFYTRIDDVYRLEIGGQDVVVRDRAEGTKEHAGLCTLGAGIHPIKLTYLAGNPLGFNFSIDWEGPGLPREPIPYRALKCVDRDSRPTASFEAKSFGDGMGYVSAKVAPHGHVIDQVSIYLGDYRVIEREETEVAYHGALPKGEQDFWVQVAYDGNRSVDLAGGTLEVIGSPVPADWIVRNMGNEGSRAGLWQTGENGFSFFGQGIHGAFKRVAGDFTVTCRIDDYAESGVHQDSWVGVAAFESAEGRNWKWGKHVYLVQTSRMGMVTAPDHADLGGSRKSAYRFPENHRWVRICRQGHLFMAWSSPDGNHWILGGTRHQGMKQEMVAGLFIRVPEQGATAHYHCKVSELSVANGVPDACLYPTPPVAVGTAGDRLTGVVMARDDANTAVVRSTAKGLMRTDDGGRTWRSINGNLSGFANAVRSVAIHPENPKIMLRAAGKFTGDALESGLWKTADGGSSWEELDFPGDFDGYGPAALCGEVLAFDHGNPELVFAGTESKGFFKSVDGGETWKSLGWENSRFTSVVVWPWGDARLAATTCTDRWMELLGRGKPAQSTKTESSRGLSARTDEDRINPYHSLESDMGIYNVAFSRMMRHPQNFRYATSHGLLHNYGHTLWGVPSYKSVEWLRPITAIHGTNLPDEKNNGLMITQSLDPEQPGRISRAEKSFGRSWHWTDIRGDVPEGGLISTTGEMNEGQKWWFVYTDGLYFSSDGGQSMVKVLSETGLPVR